MKIISTTDFREISSSCLNLGAAARCSLPHRQHEDLSNQVFPYMVMSSPRLSRQIKSSLVYINLLCQMFLTEFELLCVSLNLSSLHHIFSFHINSSV